ncbi:MAG: hypothetical protein WCF08_01640 [Anaerolineaceae bacterium]
MSGTREKILLTLLNHPNATINDLAIAAKINGISVRHHLSSLQADNLIHSEEERHGVGRPRLVYSLSEKGMEQFPTSYLKLTNHLLEQMRSLLPDSTMNKLFDKVATAIVAGYQDKIKDLSIEERLNMIKKLLEEEGFIIEWVKTKSQYEIHEIRCPYHHIGRSHPEICSIDQAVISKLLDIPVNRMTCILRGDNLCTYIVPSGIKG